MFYDGIRDHANRTNTTWDGRRLKRSDEASPTAYLIAGALLVVFLAGMAIASQVRAEKEVPAATYVTADGSARVTYR